ncbi:MAG: amidase domain-containing protein [Ruminiclostridium sp.]|nr:amidase domain-containing protein [Ruminiclostridium sp.]
MRLPEVKINKKRVIAVFSAIALMLLAGCDFEVIKIENEESENVISGVSGELFPDSIATTAPPPLELPEADEALLPENTPEYENAVNEAFNSGELSKIMPKAKVSLPGIDISSQLVNKTEAVIPKEVRELIINFHIDRYASLGALEFLSTSQYFDTTDTEGKFYSIFNDTIIEYLIYVRKNRTADLSYDKAFFCVTINEAEELPDGYKLTYMINDGIDFACTGSTSYSTYMEAEVIIRKCKDGSYRFRQYAEDTDVNLLFEEQVMKSLGYDYESDYLKDKAIPGYFQSSNTMLALLKKQKYFAQKDIEFQKKILKQVNENPEQYKITPKTKYKYDAEKAVAYSYKWVDKTEIIRNPDYSDYSIYGGNCQNYVSQCLLAGGIPMDITGDYEAQWKWYSDYANYYESAWGRVPSWAGTEAFYQYSNKNTGTGLSAKTTKYIYTARPGDVLQYVVDDWARHSVIVSKIIYDDAGNVVEILVNSNTTDHVDYPLTAYGYTEIRLIRINGYN